MHYSMMFSNWKDARLASIDEAFHLHWLSLLNWTNDHRSIGEIMEFAYGSIPCKLLAPSRSSPFRRLSPTSDANIGDTGMRVGLFNNCGLLLQQLVNTRISKSTPGISMVAKGRNELRHRCHATQDQLTRYPIGQFQRGDNISEFSRSAGFSIHLGDVESPRRPVDRPASQRSYDICYPNIWRALFRRHIGWFSRGELLNLVRASGTSFDPN